MADEPDPMKVIDGVFADIDTADPDRLLDYLVALSAKRREMPERAFWPIVRRVAVRLTISTFVKLPGQPEPKT